MTINYAGKSELYKAYNQFCKDNSYSNLLINTGKNFDEACETFNSFFKNIKAAGGIVRNQEKEYVNYYLKPTEKRYEDLSVGGSFVTSRSSGLFTKFDVLFYTEDLMDRLRRDHYSVLPPGYSEKAPTNLEPGALKQFIQEKVPEFKAEHALKIDFKKAYWKPRNVITKFREGFDWIRRNDRIVSGRQTSYLQ